MKKPPTVVQDNMSTSLALIERDAVANPLKMKSEALGLYVSQQMTTVLTVLSDLKPYIEELWARFDTGEVILGCSTRREFCEQVLQRTPRAVRYMLEGGNHNRGETVSPPKPKTEPHQVTDEEFAQYLKEYPNDIRKVATKLLGHKGMTPDDVTGALIGMSFPKPMAEAVVRIVTGQPPVTASISEPPQELRLEICSRSDPRYDDIREDHYIPNHGCIGEQAHFLIHYKGNVAGIISGASPVFSTSPRDQFFGLTHKNRGKFLQGIVNNTVFRLINRERNLATQVLTMWRNIIPHLWYEKYGTVVYGFETLVIENDTRKGTLYKADNWTLVGKTAGATKIRNGIEKPANHWKNVHPKLVYCCWRNGFTVPCSARTPEWVLKMCGDISRSPEDQPWKTRTIEERSAAAGSKSWSPIQDTEKATVK